MLDEFKNSVKLDFCFEDYGYKQIKKLTWQDFFIGNIFLRIIL
tara:strand:- start:2600 stop:2728 length:129 start_codon:yes stop_codon:yes gene_type:complete